MPSLPKRILVTGANGFIGKNLVVRLDESAEAEVLTFDRTDSLVDLHTKVQSADVIVHLAGENRPQDPHDFLTGNVLLTQSLCDAIEAGGSPKRLLLASSTQAPQDTPYGQSKLQAERIAEHMAMRTHTAVAIYRLPGVFGKWCRPNYNSVVATFCHNIARGMPIHVRDPSASIQLVYVDDVISSFLTELLSTDIGVRYVDVPQSYTITLGQLAEQIQSFVKCRHTLEVARVGEGLTRALYATFISHLPPDEFSYPVPAHSDGRGVFVEMLKTRDSGQFSYFTAHPGATRGSHYHHTKTEKFLVMKGQARFRFRHLLTGETYEVVTSGQSPRVVDTIPGWAHDITNIGSEELVVLLWANELFDRQRPDTTHFHMQS